MDKVYQSNLKLFIEGYLNVINKTNLDLNDSVMVEDLCINLSRLLGALRDYQSKYLILD